MFKSIYLPKHLHFQDTQPLWLWKFWKLHETMIKCWWFGLQLGIRGETQLWVLAQFLIKIEIRKCIEKLPLLFQTWANLNFLSSWICIRSMEKERDKSIGQSNNVISLLFSFSFFLFHLSDKPHKEETRNMFNSYSNGSELWPLAGLKDIETPDKLFELLLYCWLITWIVEERPEYRTGHFMRMMKWNQWRGKYGNLNGKGNNLFTE